MTQADISALEVLTFENNFQMVPNGAGDSYPR